MKNKIINNYNYFSIFDLKDKNIEKLYFKFKNKYEYVFTEQEKQNFYIEVTKILEKNEIWNNASVLIVPDTENKNFLELIKLTNKKIIILKKSSKEKILEKLENQSMMKSEKQKIFKIINELNNIKMANIPGNQRKRFIDFLFEEKEFLDNNENYLFLDDSLFSGYTFLAAQKCLEKIKHNNIVLFDKN